MMRLAGLLGGLLGNPLLWMLVGAAAVLAVFVCLKRLKKARRQSRMLGTQLRDVGEFAVEEARCTLVHCTREPRHLFGVELPLMRERCIFTIDVVVKIGFDFDHIDVRTESLRRRIILRLPEMRVLTAAVDYESMAVFDEKTGVFARPKLEWHRDSMLHLTREAEEKARAYGAFERAEVSARTRLEAFVGKLYDLTEYELIIIPASGDRVDVTEEKTSACA